MSHECNHQYFEDTIQTDSLTEKEKKQRPNITSTLLDKLREISNAQPTLEERTLMSVERHGLLTNKEKTQDSERQQQFVAQMKENDELTEDDIELLWKNTKKQTEEFNKLLQRDRKHKVVGVKTVHPHLTCEEIIYALEEEENEEDITMKLLNFSFINEIRQKIAYDNGLRPLKKESKDNQMDENDEEENSDDSEAEFGGKAKGRKKKPKKKVESNYVRTKLKLDEALEKKDNFEGWSPARIKAFKSINKNPNAYYYRFNAPGETQANGSWSKEEKKMFMDRLATFDLRQTGSPQWGIFSQAIPCRVGYQCANFYRLMIKKGEIIDPDYGLDEDGNVFCKFGKGSRKRKKDNGEEPSPRKKKNNKDKDDENVYASEDEKIEIEEEPEEKQDKSPKKQNFKSLRLMNPLPGFKDPMTLEEVEKPHISPYGHVMGLKTWERILTEAPVCPFTKQTLQMRDLIKLTFENIGKYQDQIKNNE